MNPSRPLRPLLAGAALAAALAAAAPAIAAPAQSAAVDEGASSALAAALRARLDGDRSGACWAAALIDGERVQRAFACVDPRQAARIGPDAAFEIGSISKTMTAALLAELIRAGRASLDDPLADYLPAGARVPAFEGRPIRLRDVVTHRSGLPALPPGVALDPADPYARLDIATLVGALAKVELSAPPGRDFAYSNYAMMLLSYAVAHRAGTDYETLLRQGLLQPLGMRGAYVDRAPEGVRAVAGRLPNGQATPAWRFGADLAGVGGVRATLDDMVRYAQAGLAREAAPGEDAIAAVQRTLQPLPGQPPMGMNWMLLEHGGRTLAEHAGGTGGFSSYLALDRARGRAVVLLSDTSLSATGGLAGFGRHLLDPDFPAERARKAATPDAAVLDGLAGDYSLAGLPTTLRRRGGALTVQAQGQPEFELGYDDHGDFYPLQFDALLRPLRGADGRYGFVWNQGGGSVAAQRSAPAATSAPAEAGSSKAVPSKAASAKAAPAPATQRLGDFVGDYPLAPGFVLSIGERDGALYAQATGQGALRLIADGADRFRTEGVDARIAFERGGDGKIAGLTLHQNGQAIHAPRR